ncbi:MAG: DUF433 domain-containing protein [Pirellulales bacterium]
MDSFISTQADVMHGTPCFTGTRVAVRSLFDHLQAGYSIEEFLAEFPTVRREQVVGLLEYLRNDVEHMTAAGKA